MSWLAGYVSVATGSHSAPLTSRSRPPKERSRRGGGPRPIPWGAGTVCARDIGADSACTFLLSLRHSVSSSSATTRATTACVPSHRADPHLKGTRARRLFASSATVSAINGRNRGYRCFSSGSWPRPLGWCCFVLTIVTRPGFYAAFFLVKRQDSCRESARSRFPSDTAPARLLDA